MEKDGNMNNIINTINNDLDALNLEEKENINIEKNENEIKEKENKEKLLDKTLSFNSVDTNSVKSANTNNSQKTLTSEIFNDEKGKDLDLPLFTSTKYTSFKWKITHLILYLIYNWVLLFSSFSWVLKRHHNFNILQMIAHLFFFATNLMQWLYYKRGCLTNSNLNSMVKQNVDKSLKARILRSETGWIYFFAFIGSVILLYGNFIYYAIYQKKLYSEFYNINFVGTMIVSVTQIFKIEKALIENRQFLIKNDVERSLVEIHLFFGSLFFGSSYLIEIMYNFEEEAFFILLAILKFLGNIFVIGSGITLLYRYFCAGNKDLNTSDLSAYTL